MKICVIGGGISGCVAILALRRFGHSPIWITSDSHATQIKEWPESISWEGLSLLSEFIDLSEFFRDHIYIQDFHHTCWGSNELISKTNCRLQKDSQGTQLINKPALTRILFNHAKDNCKQITGRVSKVESNSSLWRIHLRNKLTINANCIVFANGGSSSIRHDLCSINHVDTLQAHHWILRQSPDQCTLVQTGSLIEACPQGWWYAATLGPQAISLIFFSEPSKILKSYGQSEYLRHHLNKTIHLKSWIQQSQWTRFSRPTIFHTHYQHLTQYADFKSNNPKQFWFSIGDAAIKHDPLSSFGTTNGIWSAITTSKHINSLLTTQSPENIIEYNDVMHQLTRSMDKKRLDVYTDEVRFADMPFWKKRVSTNS